MRFEHLIDKELINISISPFDKTSVWQNDIEPDVSTYGVYLELKAGKYFSVNTCEVNKPNEYPSLGIELTEESGIEQHENKLCFTNVEYQNWEEASKILPSIIKSIKLYDPMGEDTVSGIILYLENGKNIDVRHIFPPMTMGVSLNTDIT